MRRSEAETYYDNWSNCVTRVLSYHQEFIPTDYLAVKKDNDELIIEQNTSRTLKELTKEILLDFMCKEILKPEPNYSSYMSMIDLKTGGCSCGAWILGSDTHHEHNCKLNTKWLGWRS